jgi:hypothetical protein
MTEITGTLPDIPKRLKSHLNLIYSSCEICAGFRCVSPNYDTLLRLEKTLVHIKSSLFIYIAKENQETDPF